MVTTVNNSVLCPWKLLRELILKVPTVKKKKMVIMWLNGGI